jgi:riboflavin kinase/FMN adenylyltransferase
MALREVAPEDLTLTVGNFDGVHLGHQAVLAELTRSAGSRGTPAVVVTFEPHPLDVLSAEAPPGLLSPGDERTRLVERSGADLLLIIEFTRALAGTSAEEFLRLLSVAAGTHLVLGYDFHMGTGRSGDVQRIGAIGRSVGFGLDVVPPVIHEGRPISSSRIREDLNDGELTRANAMLGRRYALEGDVVSGAGLGRELGYPTLNLSVADRKLLPQDGVYLGCVTGVGPSARAGLVYVGRRPSVESQGSRRAEVHLLGGPPVRPDRPAAALVARIRGDRTYSSRRELSEAIGRDIETARGLLEKGPPELRTISF